MPRWFAVMGVVVLLDVPVASSPAVAVAVVGSLLFVPGGLDPVPDVVAWYQFVGVGEFLFGSAFVVCWLAPAASGSRTMADLLLAAAGVANALIFRSIGADRFRGGRHYDLSRSSPGPIAGDDPEGR